MLAEPPFVHNLCVTLLRTQSLCLIGNLARLPEDHNYVLQTAMPPACNILNLQVIDETLSSAPDMASAEAFMHFLAWLAAQFAHTVKHPSRASSSQQQPSQQAAAATCASVPLSADFFFFATLLQPLLSHMQAETPSSSLLHGSTTSVITSAAVTESSIPATGTTPKKRKGQKAGKGKMQTMQESHGRPVEWAVAAEGAASLVQLTP